MKPHTLIVASFAIASTGLALNACQSDSRTLADISVSESLPPPSPASKNTGQPVIATEDESAYSVNELAQPLVGKRQMAMQSVSPTWSRDTVTAERLPVTPDNENYAALTRNATMETARQPVSTFSIDVDTGSYANVRRFLQAGRLPPADAVREEELLNYFSYDYKAGADTEEPFSMTTELGKTPWNDQTHLLHIGLKGYVPTDAENAAANLVFLIDVSGSMNSPDKLGLLKSSISLLAHELDENDSVSIVVYAGSSGIVLEPTAGDQHRKIDHALARLTAGGSTNGAQGIELAYQLASENFRDNGINRVILATDGDFNVGISDVDTLKQLISRKRESGIALTTLGFGTGNYNDHLMEQLADTGNGSYAYIDTLGEARKVLVDELQATLMTIASDVKIQIEFNPTVVSEYRLIGYSNRQLANEDFNNDRVDAGEIGAGHTVTALYEIALHGEGGEKHSPRRYAGQSDGKSATTVHADEIAELRLRYKLPGDKDSLLSSRLVSLPDPQALAEQGASESFRFSASVAAFGQLLRGDERLADYDYQAARALAVEGLGKDPYGYRAEYLRLLDLADSLDRFSRMDHYLPENREG